MGVGDPRLDYGAQDGTTSQRRPSAPPSSAPISFTTLDRLMAQHSATLREVHHRRRDALVAHEDELSLQEKKLKAHERQRRELEEAREELHRQEEREKKRAQQNASLRYHEYQARMPEDGHLQLGLRSPKQRSGSSGSSVAEADNFKELPPLPSSHVPHIREPLRSTPRYNYLPGGHQFHGDTPHLAGHSIAAANDRLDVRQPLILSPIPDSVRTAARDREYEHPPGGEQISASPTGSLRGRFLQPFLRRSPSREKRKRVAKAEKQLQAVVPSQRPYYPTSRPIPESPAQRKTRSWPIVFNRERGAHSEAPSFGIFGRPRKTATV